MKVIAAQQPLKVCRQLSKATQQNASASEELASTSEELSSQAEQLQSAVSFFNLGGDASLQGKGSSDSEGKSRRRPGELAAARPGTASGSGGRGLNGVNGVHGATVANTKGNGHAANNFRPY